MLSITMIRPLRSLLLLHSVRMVCPRKYHMDHVCTSCQGRVRLLTQRRLDDPITSHLNRHWHFYAP
ncbi:hypothetical protein M758_UG255100 [Ceratodon purpureus]|nr:hypothetical protein M758_UG255100 [Ceratodon purpureus]